MRRIRICLLLAVAAACLVSPAGAAAANPTLGLAATGAEIGSAVHATATLAEGSAPTGSISFDAYGPGDPTCVGTPVFSDSATVSGNGDYPSADFTPLVAGTYHWTAIYSGDLENELATSICSAESVVTKATPGLSTTATSATVGSAIADSATLSGGSSPTGSITFKAFGPNNATCEGTPAFEADASVSGNGVYGSGNFTPGTAGSYRWTAAYSGDANNAAATSACNAANETSTVAKASTGLATTATGATVGSPISDSGDLTGGLNVTGQITFKAFGPNNASCANPPAFEVSVSVSGGGVYGSGDFTPTAAGAYRWTASYSGDANNAAATSACNAANETSTVAKAAPALATTATSAPFGFPIADSATLSDGFSPTGQITFKAFGPSDATCANAAAFVATIAVTGNGSYGSGDFNNALTGSYRWTASYSGDANNAAATSACNAANETSTVGKSSPALTTIAANATIGSPISDSATLSGGFSPTGQISFAAFGPTDPNCLGTPVFTANVAVTGNGSYGSGSSSPSLPLGEYRWTVSYAGDANNSATSSPCNAPNETSVVSKFAPTLAPSASNATIGSSIADIATFGGGSSRTGQIVFRAYGPADATCSGGPVFAATVDVTPGNGTYASGAFTPAQAGIYRWTASYSGDQINAATTTPCNGANSVSTVAQATPAIATKASAASLPIGTAIRGTATIAAGYKPSGTISFRLYGPGNANCSSPPVFTDTVPVSGNAAYASGGIAPAQPGQYFLTASYSGDAANRATASPCNAAGAAVVVKKRSPSLSARVSLRGTSRIAARAIIAGAAAPKGKILFQLFGPNNSRCAGKPVFSERVAVHGGGSYQPSVFQAGARGVYRLTVAYAGDAWNMPARSGCNKTGQAIRVGSK